MHVLTGPPHVLLQAIFNTLKIVLYGLIAPFVLVAMLAALMCVLLDFIWFRIHEMLLGNPAPKGLWEF